ncbi:MAG: Cytochrome b/c1 [Alphaproteobacteria bacterium MarineAlpha5_Bin9]|nr:MAG: Cytochrome b/c1 [Alphaproteobacteria bacterium MarineAlpha5_Bin9]|tara:strand:+ start:5579 stop:6382 length:804 start_codon:yes stop_codon:yes gene_type:complete
MYFQNNKKIFLISKDFFRLFLIIFLISLLPLYINAKESSNTEMPKHDWSFKGVTGVFDNASVQRGFKVYREVCAVCHSMNLLYYRDLIDVGFTEEEIKVISSEYKVIDGPNEEGSMYERPAIPSDRFVDPYLNKEEARISNNGSYPPDLSVITKARKYGVDYLHNLLMGYSEPPENFELGDGMYYNLWIEGNQIAMPQPLYDESVEYDDKTPNDLEQLSRDLVTFLAWAAEPELEERKNLGIKVILFFILFGFLVFLAKIRLWREIN